MKHILITIAAVVLVGCGPSVDIHKATEEGNIEAVKQAIADGADANTKDDDGRTPLHYAANEGHMKIAGLLISKGADLNAKDKIRGTPLHYAAAYEHKEIVELIIAADADLKAKDEEGATPLHNAAFIGNKEIAQLLIAKGADVSAKTANGITTLHSAAGGGQKQIVELLIAKVEDVNAKDVEGYTPLHWAARHGQKQIAELLIAKGADVNAQTDARLTPLHYVGGSAVGSMEVAELLITKGADVNARDNYGDTPLHYSAYARHYPRVRLLLSKGAFINRVGIGHKSEATPLDCVYLANDFFSKNIPNIYQQPQLKADANKIIALLKKQGGKTSKLLMAKYRPKKNSLFNAIQGRDLELAKKLIKDGADIEERGGRESGKRSATPLYYAAYNVDPAMTKLLLESGANVNAVDYQGEIPLHTAIYHSYPNVEEDGIEVIKMLIENGSDVNKVKSFPFKLTPLDFAKDPNGKIADLLRKHGGKTGEELKAEEK